MAETALVTGASSGIGEEFARRLADRGYDLALVARRADRLKRLAGQLPTNIHVVRGDLADAASVSARVAELGVDIDLLVNNAGFGTFGRFWEIPDGRDAELVRLNCEAVVALTRAFLPPMLERGRGGIINVASSAGMQLIPYEATYAASKAFVISFTDALATELRGTGVRAMSVNPGPVPTEWQDVAGVPETGGPPGEIPVAQVVREALAAWDRGRRLVIPGRTIRWFIRVTKPSPRPIQLRVTERMFRPKD